MLSTRLIDEGKAQQVGAARLVRPATARVMGWMMMAEVMRSNEVQWSVWIIGAFIGEARQPGSVWLVVDSGCAWVDGAVVVAFTVQVSALCFGKGRQLRLLRIDSHSPLLMVAAAFPILFPSIHPIAPSRGEVCRLQPSVALHTIRSVRGER